MNTKPGETHQVQFIPSGRGKAQCPADPNYPDGRKLTCAPPDMPACTILLPYPAPECGLMHVTCNVCGMQVTATVAGRPDDPTQVTIPCRSDT